MTSNVWAVIGAIAAVLAVGSLIRLVALRSAPREEVRERLGSLAVWWIMLSLLTAAAWLGPAGMIALVTLIQAWALGEYFVLRWPRNAVGLPRFAAFVALPVNGLLIYFGWQEAALVFLPLIGLLVLPSLLVLADRPAGYVREAAETAWSLLLVGYGLSHLGLLSVLPAVSNPRGGAAGWFLFVVLLTQTNDIAQALCGRRFGSRPLARRLSPKKTWEGFFGGLLVTMLLAVAVGHWLTPLTSAEPLRWSGWTLLPGWWPALLVGGVLAVAGLLGDLTVSGIKRDAGVKNSGRSLPGQGGILDRVDSLLFTSPITFYLVKWLYE